MIRSHGLRTRYLCIRLSHLTLGYGYKIISMLPATISQFQQAKFATSSGCYVRKDVLDRREIGWREDPAPQTW